MAAAGPTEGSVPDTTASSGAPPPPRRGSLSAVLGVIGFLILAGGIGYVWRLEQQQAQTAAAAQVPELRQQVQGLRQQIQGLRQQLGQLRQARPAAPGDVKALSDRINALNGRVIALEHRQAPDLTRIQARLAALEQRQPVDLKGLRSDVKNLQQEVAAGQQKAAANAQLSQQIDALTKQVQQVATRSQQADSALTQRLDTDESRLVTLEQSAAKITRLTDRANRLARLQSAQMALAQGQKLGPIPGAPPALARFADMPPPTEAALRLSFPAAARAAVAASTPNDQGKPFLARMLAHAEQLVTVRRGNQVLVGDETASVLATARADLDAGDLAAAVAAVSGLSGPPAKAMSQWLGQAKALLAARSALTDMVAHT